MRRETFTGQILSTKLLLILFLITINLQKFACASIGLECNGTTSIGECLADHGDEFLMESETSTKLLAAGNGKQTRLSFGSLEKPPICNATVYASCIGDQKNVAGRSCTDFNRCKHDPKNN